MGLDSYRPSKAEKPSDEGLDPKEQLEESARRSEARVKDQIDQLRRGLNKKE